MATMAATAEAAPATTRFAAACGALSHYVRARAPAPARPLLPLMPGADVDTAAALPMDQGQGQEAAAQAQVMTIVYGGRVLVLDAVPADKAAGLQRLAATAAAAAGGRTERVADLPVARKASLQRFMEKRRGRAAAARAAPYRRPDADAGAWPESDDHLKLAL